MSYDSSIRFQCMDDCIHLKACRRLQKIAKSKWLNLPRYCSEECTAYETIEDCGDGTVRLIPGMHNNEEECEYQQHYAEKQKAKEEERREREEYEKKCEAIQNSARLLAKELDLATWDAQNLCWAGFDSIEKIKAANDDELLKLRNYGPVRISKLKGKVDAWEKHYNKQSE